MPGHRITVYASCGGVSRPHANRAPFEMKCLTAGIVLLLAAGCAHTTPSSSQTALPDIYERSTHSVTQAPEQAAACIVANAKNRDYFASAAPLSGMTVMSVTVRTIPAGGETLAIITLQRDAGSATTAAVTTPAKAFADRTKSLGQLLAGC